MPPSLLQTYLITFMSFLVNKDIKESFHYVLLIMVLSSLILQLLNVIQMELSVPMYFIATRLLRDKKGLVKITMNLLGELFRKV